MHFAVAPTGLDEYRNPAVVLAHPADLRVGAEVEPFVAQGVVHGARDFGLVLREDPLRALQHGDPRAEAPESLRELERDVSPADDDERSRLLGELDVLIRREQIAREVWDLVEAR